MKTIKVPEQLSREASAIEIRTEGDKISYRMSISSDTPYLRYGWTDEDGWSEYYEVLDHSPGGFVDDRLKAGLPMLYNHQRSTHLGRARQYMCDGKRITVDDVIWSSSEVATEKKTDFESGVLIDTSVGYSILDDGECVGAKDGIPIYKFRWEPQEFSLVTIAADVTVGAGRNSSQKPEGEFKEVRIREKQIDNSENHTSPKTTDANQMKRSNSLANRRLLAPDNGGGAGGEEVVDPAKARAQGIADYKARCKKIDDYVASLKNEKWKASAAKIAEKHKAMDEPNFDEFRSEALNGFTMDEETQDRSRGIIVIGDRPQRALSVGAQFVRSKDFQERGPKTGHRRSIAIETDMSMIGIRGKVELANRGAIRDRAFDSANLAAINVAPQQQLIALGMERLTIMDLIAPGTTSAAAIPYPKETSQGTLDGVAVDSGRPKAGMVGERGVKPTWEPDITTDTANVKKIAVVTKVPDEFLADFPAFQSYIDARLPAMVDFQAENQVLYGDGIGNNIKGILTNAGVQTRAYATSWASTIKKAITDVEVGSFFTADGIAMHPYDWEVASLEVDLNGQHFAGGPFYIPYGNGIFMELRTFWGKPVAVTTAVTVGQPVVGCWKLGAQYFMREGMRIESTNANEDDFKRNLVALRAEERLALATYRPACFLEVTGGPARA